ncbi:hypothetical protein ASF69_04455 [Rhizobium sp. Leaf311]|uniref:hypothetical protein n=1 Tax=Rhizobium sp. Leaf311 TaxID=1736332 RepID=UPI0007142292|nr:hypothetical protein [Rhizobium sp. Leaf311]KQQ46486.1 hypothetical protein ASF69_04455 [Rhizobium sp. Leaf311]
MARYLNPCHKPHDSSYGPAFYETDVNPTEYKGFKIYNVHHMRFDCVLEDATAPVCMMQMAGINGAKGYIDKFWNKQNAA